MENILIIYKSKYGAAREYAQLLEKPWTLPLFPLTRPNLRWSLLQIRLFSAEESMPLPLPAFLSEEKHRSSQWEKDGCLCSGGVSLRPEDS